MKALHKLTELELLELRNSIKSGVAEDLINKHLDTKIKQCPICTSVVEEGKLTLLFEEGSFKKKASFCGNDCLKYFVDNQIKTNIFENLNKNI